MYCLEFLNTNYQWLRDKVLEHQDEFLIFDLPGQLELFLNSDALRSVLLKLRNDLGSRRLKATVVELFDAHYVQDCNKFLSACTYSLVSMVNLELPHINVLSKVDLLENAADLDFRMEYYLDCSDFEPLAKKLEKSQSTQAFNKRFSKLSANICQMLENYQMTSFKPLDIMDKVSVSNLLHQIDKCNGFVIDSREEENIDVREYVAKNVPQGSTLTKFDQKVEMDEESQMVAELAIYEKLAKGEIDDDEADRLLANLR